MFCLEVLEFLLYVLYPLPPNEGPNWLFCEESSPSFIRTLNRSFHYMLREKILHLWKIKFQNKDSTKSLTLIFNNTNNIVYYHSIYLSRNTYICLSVWVNRMYFPYNFDNSLATSLEIALISVCNSVLYGYTYSST